MDVGLFRCSLSHRCNDIKQSSIVYTFSRCRSSHVVFWPLSTINRGKYNLDEDFLQNSSKRNATLSIELAKLFSRFMFVAVCPSRNERSSRFWIGEAPQN